MHVRLAIVVGLSTLSLVGTVAAQVDAERFKPAVTTDGWVNAEGSAVRNRQDPLELGLYLNYGRNQVVIVDADGDLDQQFVAGRFGVDLLGSVTLAKPFAIGLDLPFFVAQTGDPAGLDAAGLGDLRIVPKLRLLDDRDSIGLALAMELRAPTHTGDFSGSDGPIVVWPKVILDHRFRKGVRVGANVGAAFREQQDFLNVSAGSELTYAAALGYRFQRHTSPIEVGGELNGGVGLTQTDPEELPLEGFLYLRAFLGHDWELQGGPGFGLLPGYGVPTWRFFAGVRWRPTRHDRDHDGIPDDEDQCPDRAEDQDHFEDLDGCPEHGPDQDRDGVPDYDDQCPDAKETINGVEDEDGCPDSGDARVVYEDGELKILDRVRFEHGSATLEEDSESTLDQVALILKANPEFERVEVQGHTDSSGPEEVNQRLSEQRAQAVRGYLIGRGIEPARLEAKGYGESEPLRKGEGDKAMSENRRVEFVITESSEGK